MLISKKQSPISSCFVSVLNTIISVNFWPCCLVNTEIRPDLSASLAVITLTWAWNFWDNNSGENLDGFIHNSTGKSWPLLSVWAPHFCFPCYFVYLASLIIVSEIISCWICEIDSLFSCLDYPGQMTASQSQLAGPDGKGDPSRENSSVDFSKV